jgi:hypothetical protein
MQRTLNYTGRQRIEQKQALFSFTDTPSETPEFDVVFNIDPEEFPQDAVLYVEAHWKETRQRFDFGTVSRITPPANRRLEQIDVSERMLFDVIVVGQTGKHGVILASGENFRADAGDDDKSKSSILSVKTDSIGQLTWKVEFETGGLPELVLSNAIPNVIERMRTDPTFQALILPAALKEVLIYYLWNNEDEDENEGCERWMAFASLFAEDRMKSEDPVELFRWVDEVVKSFSERFHLADMLVTATLGDSE